MLNLFAYIRNGVRRATLLGVNDAVEELDQAYQAKLEELESEKIPGLFVTAPKPVNRLPGTKPNGRSKAKSGK